MTVHELSAVASNKDGYNELLKGLGAVQTHNSYVSNRPDVSGITMFLNDPNSLIIELPKDPGMGLERDVLRTVAVAASELMRNVVHGLTSESLNVIDKNPKVLNLGIQTACELGHQMIASLTICYDDQRGRGCVEVVHPVIPGISKPIDDPEAMRARRKSELEERYSFGGLYTLEDDRGAVTDGLRFMGYEHGLVIMTDVKEPENGLDSRHMLYEFWKKD